MYIREARPARAMAWDGVGRLTVSGGDAELSWLAARSDCERHCTERAECARRRAVSVGAVTQGAHERAEFDGWR